MFFCFLHPLAEIIVLSVKSLANVFTFTYQIFYGTTSANDGISIFQDGDHKIGNLLLSLVFSDGTQLKISTYTWTPNFDDRPMSIRSWVITTSGFWKRTSAILELYFRFLFGPVHRHRHCILHRRTKFHPNRSTHGGVMTSYRFLKMAAGSPVGFCVGNIKPRTNCNCGSSLIYKYGVDRIYNLTPRIRSKITEPVCFWKLKTKALSTCSHSYIG